ANIGRSAVGYGVNRALGGKQSWNFKNVAVDAFGNALGNSIVGHIQQTERDKLLAKQQANRDILGIGANPQQSPVNGFDPIAAAQQQKAISAGKTGLSTDQLNTLSKRAESSGTTLDALLLARGSEALYSGNDQRFNNDAVFDVSASYTLLAEQKYTPSELSLSLVDKLGSMLPRIPEASEDTFAGYMWNRTLDGTVSERIIAAAKAELEILGGAAQIATGIVEKRLPFGNKMRAGLLAHGVGNYAGGIGNLSNLIYGGDRDYNITKSVYEDVAGFVGLDSKVGEKVFYGVDFAMGATLLMQPIIKPGVITINNTGVVPLQLDVYRSVPAFQTAPLPMTLNDIYQLQSAFGTVVEGN
ncbi:MAG: DUF4225 domain-containing protein, partial [Alteromonadaceae bacterium]|nr:DUF4225 domain-containing protein [Alteromonadaceae bacterium]